MDRLELIGAIDSDPVAQAHTLAQSVGDEIGRMISEQQQLGGRFEALVARQQELRGQPNKLKLQENEARAGCRAYGPNIFAAKGSVCALHQSNAQLLQQRRPNRACSPATRGKAETASIAATLNPRGAVPAIAARRHSSLQCQRRCARRRSTCATALMTT